MRDSLQQVALPHMAQARSTQEVCSIMAIHACQNIVCATVVLPGTPAALYPRLLRSLLRVLLLPVHMGPL